LKGKKGDNREREKGLKGEGESEKEGERTERGR
jgi:hypothetical protein